MFGGLIEVTKESSELFAFEIETNTWTLLKSQETYRKQEIESLKVDHLQGPDAFSEMDTLLLEKQS